MTSPRQVTRRGVTLIEVLVTMAVLVVLGGILVPTIRSMGRDTKSKAGADTLLGRVADARGAAMEAGRPYRLAVSSDGKRVLVTPDDQNASAPAESTASGSAPHVTESAMPGDVTATLHAAEGTQAAPEDGDWIRIATFQPDGSCRESSATVLISEPGVRAILVRIRGLTGAATAEAGPTPGNTL